MASIRDVAKSAGVSTATVSNVLNGRSEKVSTETRERVLAAVRLLKYRPTPLEHNQKAILSQNLGVVVPDLTEGPLVRQGYFRNVLDGVLEAAALRGWSITIFVERMWSDVGLAVRRSYDGRCDGLIMVAPQPGNEVVQTLQERGTPVVLIGTTPWLDNVSLVDVDNSDVGARAFQHLFELGHRRFAYLGHDDEQVSSVERRESFFSEARRAGIPNEHVTWIHSPRVGTGETAAATIVRKLLELKYRPTGLFCWHDGLAIEILPALQQYGCRVPEDFSILSVDGSYEAGLTNPGLTTFENPLQEIGRRATRMLIDKLVAGEDFEEFVRFPAELIVRGSTGRCPNQ